MKAAIGSLSAIAIIALPAQAEDKVELSGYATLGYQRIVDRSSGAIEKAGGAYHQGDFRSLTRFGLNLVANLTDDLAAVAQLTGAGSNAIYGTPTDNIVELQLALLRYRVADFLTVRIGKHVLPAWQNSEMIDVGIQFPWVRVPQEVHILVPVKALEGVTTTWTANAGPVRLALDLTGGAMMDAPANGITLDLPKFYNAALTARYDNTEVRGSYFFGDFTLHISPEIPTPMPNPMNPAAPPTMVMTKLAPMTMESKVTRYSFGVKSEFAGALLTGEYAAGKNELTGSPQLAEEKLSALYGTAGYEIGDFFPHVTYAQYENKQKSPMPMAPEMKDKQFSVAAGMNYWVNPAVVVKSQVTRIKNNGDKTSDVSGLEKDQHATLVGFAVSAVF